ncbi:MULTISPECIES: translation elongation factor Ts [Empedobacter]|uniref:translation elongation factor Ts n=1 Tax=Empedobacter TaxID=59734 RepID=UPI001C560688|nr:MULTISPECIES: translation elongation factor Ts [Empedobacter]MBW1617128.1 elongation factor Ts [Empedobacter falsenii]MBY0066011.1 translation elongation factor Ts [Empedobacter falsenii]MDM1137211.1 elongation factor Ts [Empedobacter sp. R132-2]
MSYKATAAEVSKLRNATGAGMMDSKKALEEAGGDFDKAVEVLRKQGQKVAAKRADRDSTEGAVIAKVNADQTKGIVIALNCETDFVAKNEAFVAMANEIADLALTVNSKEELLALPFAGITVGEKLTEQTGVIGEKIEIGTFQAIEGAIVNSYIHAGNKIGAVVSLSANVEGASEVARDVAMQVAAMNPVALDETSVAQSVIDTELSIARETLVAEGKPENMIENIAQGKLQKFFKENTLVHQASIKDGKTSVQDIVKAVNADLKVTGFIRYSL